MGICWSCVFCRKTPDPEQPAAVAADPDPVPIPDSDAEPAAVTIGHYLNDGDTSFLGSNLSGNSWFSMVTTNFTSWISQASGAIAAIWENNAAEDEFLGTLDEETLPDVETTAIDSKLRVFTFAELRAATCNFRLDMKLGMGGFGTVYKGWLKEKVPSQHKGKLKEKGSTHYVRKRAIAIKRLDINSKQGIRQWRAEVGFLGRLTHPNIVKILGYCRENEELLLVYEFMCKGSLNYHLFGKRSSRTLPWNIRVKIMIEMARALCYMHSLQKPIIYRDFKSSNVLLDESYTAKISDFGLAKCGSSDGPYIRGHVMGTVGYVDPYYASTGNLHLKSDVYSFGVVLIEMLTGLRAVDKKRSIEKRELVSYVKHRLTDRSKLRRIMDARLEGLYSPKEASAMALIASRCVHQIPELRPSMKEVAETLEQLEARYQKQAS